MVINRKIKWFIAIVAAVLLVAVGEIVRVDSTTISQPQRDGNISEITGDILVGQTFWSEYDDLSGISIMFATYSGRNNTEPLIFHLRRSISDEHDLRSKSIKPGELTDNQFYQIDIEVVEDSAGENFWFFVTSPYSTPGNAVTVNISREDPYFRGSAYLVHGQDIQALNRDVLERSGKQEIDLAFQAHHQVPLRTATFNVAKDMGRQFAGSWGEKRSGYWLWFKVALPGLIWLGILVLVDSLFNSKSKIHKWQIKAVSRLLLMIFFLAMVTRLLYAVEMPATNDEGNYLYDARTLLEGKLAGGDGYVKTPLVIGWIAAWIGVLGNSLLVGRLSSVVIGALIMWPLYFIARELAGKKAGIMAAATWALFGVTTVFNVYVHTQSLAIFFGVSAVAILLAALRGISIPGITEGEMGRPGDSSVFLATGILFALGVISRKSILAMGLIPLVMVLIESRGWRLKMNQLGLIGVGFLIIVSGFLMMAGYMYGVEGFWEAIGFNSAEDGVSAVEEGQEEQVRIYSLKGMTPFFRESLPLIMLAVIGLGYYSEKAIHKSAENMRTGGTFRRVWVVERILGRAGWLIALAVYWWAWSFFAEYEGSSIMVFGMSALWYVMLAVVILAIFLPRPKVATSRPAAMVENISEERKARERLSRRKLPNVMKGMVNPAALGQKKVAAKKEIDSGTRQVWSGLFLAPLWLVGLVFFYMNWIKFHANYIGEFLPPLVILAGIGAPVMWGRIAGLPDHIGWWSGRVVAIGLRIGVAVIMLWAMFVSGFVTYVYDHTGTFQLAAVAEAADWAVANIPQDKVIFTGAGLIPFISGHHTALDIAHPRWYAYEWIRTDETRLNTFLPSRKEMLAAFREAEWFLLDKQTGFSFLMEYAEIEQAILEEQGWERVHGIENGSNTLTFYRRTGGVGQSPND